MVDETDPADTYVTRMHTENDELCDRISRGEAFFHSDSVTMLSAEQIALLGAQISAMKAYQCILAIRLTSAEATAD